MDKQILSQTSVELSHLIKSKNLSPVELTSAYLNEIEQSNPRKNIYITVSKELAQDQAQQAESEIMNGNYRGPLHGIPFSCKDLFFTKGIKTTGGSRVLKDFIPRYDATVIQHLFNSGAILLGKTNMHEFAYGATGENPYYGTVANPYDETRNAGGSSSGSAAAVASGNAVFSLGTDTGGSVRAPSALCGVVGLKPTYGLISLHGVVPYCWSLDHFGVSTRTIHDAALVLESVSNQTKPEFKNQGSSSPKELRIGIPRSFFFENAEDEILNRTESIINSLKADGYDVVDVKSPNLDYSRTVSLLIQLPEVLSYHSRYFKDKQDLYGMDILAGMAVGQFILSEHYVRAKRIAELYKKQVENIFKEVDVLLTPSGPITAPLIDQVNITTAGRTEAKGNAITRFTSFFNITGNPAVSIPSGMNSKGLPMGVQLIGKHYREKDILHVGTAIENIVKTIPGQPDKTGATC